MKRAIPVLAVLILTILMGCAAVQPTPERVFAETQTAYINAWDSYHKVWLVLPETQKAEWAKKYHPKFYRAADLLQKFHAFPTATNEQLLTQALNECESILIELAIKKGAK